MKGVFKCALCGAEGDGSVGLEHVDKKTAYGIVKNAATTEKDFVWLSGNIYHPGFFIRGIHACPDGSIGITYFSGFKMEENEEKEKLDFEITEDEEVFR